MMKSLQFDNGDYMPIFGLGTWKSRPDETYRAIEGSPYTLANLWDE